MEVCYTTSINKWLCTLTSLIFPVDYFMFCVYDDENIEDATGDIL